MIDVAKVADVVLLLIDATFGIEMEVFEFLEICKAHGTPRVMGGSFRLVGSTNIHIIFLHFQALSYY